MGAPDDPMAVTDPAGQVRGCAALRVVVQALQDRYRLGRALEGEHSEGRRDVRAQLHTTGVQARHARLNQSRAASRSSALTICEATFSIGTT